MGRGPGEQNPSKARQMQAGREGVGGEAQFGKGSARERAGKRGGRGDGKGGLSDTDSPTPDFQRFSELKMTTCAQIEKNEML